MKKILLFLFIIPVFSFAQYQISGVLTDADTKETLPFATIITNNNQGTITDIDGKFIIESTTEIKEISISYIGYESKKIAITEKIAFLKIVLKQNIESLNEVIISTAENPALQIIRNTIKNKSKNDVEKSLNSFRFKAYNKLLVTANPDSIQGGIDSIFKIVKGKKILVNIDSSHYEFKKRIDRSHLYLSEKIAEHTFEKGKNKKETILASRMAGFKQPIYEVLAINIQDYSTYNEIYTVAGNKYINPIANNALKHYDYQILDTVNNTNGKSYMIHFKPKKEKDVIGLEGVLYVDNTTFAITSSISELRGVLDIKANQDFKYLKENNKWFPSKTSITIKQGENKKSMTLFGGITITPDESKKDTTLIRPKRKSTDDQWYFSSKTTHFDIETNIPLKVKRNSNTIEIDENAYDKNKNYWNKYRTDSITKRGLETYVVIDSLAKEENVEDKINLVRNLLKGYYPTKYINLDIGKIFNYNNYEGFRFGIGGVTNTNFSKKFRLESYVAYGTKDTNFKYHLGGAIRLNRDTNSWIGVSYTDDVKEAANMEFLGENNSFLALNPRSMNVSQFYNYKTINLLLEHDIQPNLEAKLKLSTGDYKPKFDYQYISNDKLLSGYKLTTATLGLEYNPKNKYMNSPIGKTRIKNEYPQFKLQVTKSFENVMESNFDFTQINFKAEYQIKRLRASTTSFLFKGGIVFGEAPISHLYNASPNGNFKNPWINRITMSGNSSFETMAFNEFVSDKFAMFQVKHQFKSWKLSNKFSPQINLVSRAAIGDIKNPINHTGILLKSMNKGYFESGIEFNSLFKGFGISTFYRYGAYKNTQWSDNLSVKLTYRLSFGF